MKTAMRKTDGENRTLARRSDPAQQKAGGLHIPDNRSQSLAQMKLMESIQAKEDLQRQAGPEEEEELLQG
jgi:hypothetical protein